MNQDINLEPGDTNITGRYGYLSLALGILLNAQIHHDISAGN